MTRILSNEQAIRLGFAQLRRECDPRGHGLLDALEKVCLAANEIPKNVQARLDEVFACDIDESAGLAELVELRGPSKKVS